MTQKNLNIQQKWWVKLIKDYDYMIEFYLGKANVVIDALNCKNRVVDTKLDGCDEREFLQLRKIGVRIEVGHEGSLLALIRVKSIFQEKSTRSSVKG
jgi:hypothetical protein